MLASVAVGEGGHDERYPTVHFARLVFDGSQRTHLSISQGTLYSIACFHDLYVCVV